MNQRKTRKPLDAETVGLTEMERAFIKGETEAIPVKAEVVDPEPFPAPKPKRQTKPKQATPPKEEPTIQGSFMSQLLSTTTEKEPTVRVTVDMPRSLHQKLSMLCARTGAKKADVIRGLLAEALQQVDE